MANKKIDKKPIKKLGDNLADVQKENFLGVVGDFVGLLSKKDFIQNFAEKDKDVILQAISCLSHISGPELKIAQKTPEYKKIYALLQDSKIKGELNSELSTIYEKNKKFTKNWLHLKRGKIVRNILGNQFNNYQKIKKRYPNKAQKVLVSKLQTAEPKTIEVYDLINLDLLLFDSNPLILKLTPTILLGNFKDSDFFAYVSFLILYPKHQLSSFLTLDKKWEEFPLKWYAYHQPIPLIKSLFYYYKKGYDVAEYFVQKYKKNDFKQIKELINSHYLFPPNSYILSSRVEIIDEIIKCYEQKYFASSVCTSLPIIEGILWEFSIYVQQREGGIYTDEDCKKIFSRNGNEISDVTIGQLLKHSKFSEIFDKYFINYFCDELYNERNPILHGKDLLNFTEQNASKKLATVEYLLCTINNYIKEFMMDNLEKQIPDEIKTSIMETLKKNKKEA